MTGLTGGASAGTRQFARVCSKVGSADVKVAVPPIELVENSNSKCGDAGIYVFGVEGMGHIYQKDAKSKSESFKRSLRRQVWTTICLSNNDIALIQFRKVFP